MANLTAKEQSFVEMMTRSSEHARKGFELLVKRADLERFFEPLAMAGLFDPAQNPAIVPAEDPGYYRVPYWDALDYLAALAKAAGETEDLTLAKKVMDVVRAVSRARERDGTVRDNYHTFRKFAVIVGLVPRASVTLEDIDMVRDWLNSKFDHGSVTNALDEGLMARFIESDQPEDWRKAVAILRYCTAIRWVDERGIRTARKKAVALADDFWLRRMMKNHLVSLSQKVPNDVASLFLERLSEVFAEENRNEMSWLWRPSVEDHFQNHSFREVENLFVEGLRDALLLWTDREPQAASQFVAQMMTNSNQIIRRVGLFIIAERWQHLRGLYFSNLAPQLFESGHLHELYRLLKNNFAAFTDQEGDATLTAIRELPMPTGEDVERRLKRIQMRWLSAVIGKGYEPAEAWYSEITADPEVGRISENPDFHSYMQSRVGPGPTPYPPEELVNLAENGTLIEKLNGFQQQSLFGGPTREALVQSLQDAVVQHPEAFIDILPSFIQAEPQYQWAVVNGFKRHWNENDLQKAKVDWNVAWSKLVSFFETLFSLDDFWKGEPHEGEDDTPVRTDVPVLIADFIRDGTRTDEKAFAPNLLPRTWGMITTLLARLPKSREPGEDVVNRAINAPRGRTIEALFGQALRTCRLENHATGKHDDAWGRMCAVFEQELEMCKNDNYEFSTLAGQYLAHLDWMSHEWLSQHLKEIFAIEFPKNFRCAVEGLAYATATQSIYMMLAQNGILDSALQLDLKGDGREQLVQRIVVAYLWGDEELESSRLKLLFQTNESVDLESGVDLLCSANPDELKPEQVERILLYWDRCLGWKPQNVEPPANLLSTLSRFARFIKSIGSRELDRLLAVAPYVHVGHRSDEFIRELNRLADRNPAEVTLILKKLIQARKPDSDYEDKLKSLILKLADGGELQAAVDIVAAAPEPYSGYAAIVQGSHESSETKPR